MDTFFNALASLMRSIPLFHQYIIHEKADQHILCDFENMIDMVNAIMVNQHVIKHPADIVQPFPGI